MIRTLRCRGAHRRPSSARADSGPSPAGRVARLLLPGLLALATTVALPARAAAQGDSMFIPYIGWTTGGDTRTTGTTYGFSTAYLENGWGGELDVAHSTAFNDVDFESSGLTTVMLNLLASPRLHRLVRPYVVAGLGLIRARGCGGPSCVREFSRTALGIDAGGGAFVPLNDTFGLRGDVRYFRYASIYQDLPRTDNGPFDFWRISAAGTFTW